MISLVWLREREAWSGKMRCGEATAPSATAHGELQTGDKTAPRLCTRYVTLLVQQKGTDGI